ncbi:MAG TPA: alpha/beta hydrolase [Acidimicrobiales bacterium]|nr:alpha/beta hydrolase [Acidimicrobiales bacterium]
MASAWRGGSVLSRVALIVATLLLVACGSTTNAARVPGGSSTTTAAAAPATTTALPTTTTAIAAPHLAYQDVAYASKSPAEKLDLYVPTKVTATPGLVMYVHGGGWNAGDKAAEYTMSIVGLLVSNGYAVASINYRLSTEATFPAQIQDVKAAVRWLRANAARYGYDPTRIAAAGDSAGGNLVALLATSGGVPALDDPRLGNSGVPDTVNSVILLYPAVDLLAEHAWLAANPACAGGYSDPDLGSSPESKYLGAPVPTVPARAEAANPTTYVTRGRPLPKFLIGHGDADCTAPYQGSVELYDAIVKAAGPDAAQLFIVKGSGHWLQFNANSIITPALDLLHQTIGG